MQRNTKHHNNKSEEEQYGEEDPKDAFKRVPESFSGKGWRSVRDI